MTALVKNVVFKTKTGEVTLAASLNQLGQDCLPCVVSFKF